MPTRTRSARARSGSRQAASISPATPPQRVDDLEAARKALGYHQIDLLRESAGTRTAMLYSWRYPTAIHRSVRSASTHPAIAPVPEDD